MFEIIVTEKSGQVSSFGTVKSEKGFIAWVKRNVKSEPWGLQLRPEFSNMAQWLNSIKSAEIAEKEATRFFNVAKIKLTNLA